MESINRKNPLPLYVQLKYKIKYKIENYIWSPGFKIPTELELEKEYQLSRTTIRLALQELVSEGRLIRIQGKGTYVANPKLESIRPELTGFTKDMKSKGHIVYSKVLNFSRKNPSYTLQKKFSMDESQNIILLERIRFVDDISIGHHEVYINSSVAPNLFSKLSTYDFSIDSLYEALEKENISLGSAEETVEASIADEYQAEILNIKPGDLILLMQRLTRLKNGEIFEVSYMFY